MSKKFTSDFKRECVELVTIQGHTTKQVAENMDVGYSSLQKWVRQYRAEQRGVEDILTPCVDGLKGFPDAINAVFPQTNVQLCIVHMVRN